MDPNVFFVNYGNSPNYNGNKYQKRLMIPMNKKYNQHNTTKQFSSNTHLQGNKSMTVVYCNIRCLCKDNIRPHLSTETFISWTLSGINITSLVRHYP